MLNLLNDKKDKILRDHLPEIKKILCTKVLPTAQGQLTDPKNQEWVFKTLYAFLPRPITVFVSEDSFLKFCIKNANSLIENQLPAVNKEGNQLIPESIESSNFIAAESSNNIFVAEHN